MAAATVLYDQTDHVGTTTSGSTNCTDLPSVSGQTADDFRVPVGQHWSPTELDVRGTSSGSANAPINAYLYANSGGLPGTQLAFNHDVAAPGAPDFTIPLSAWPTLAPGTYWVSAQLDAACLSGFDWEWTDRAAQSFNPAAFRGNGACSTNPWVARDSCDPSTAAEPDQLFALKGTATIALTVAKAGSGSGTVTSSPGGINCGSTCSHQFPGGSGVTLTAAPKAGSTFAGWSGSGCSGTGTCTVTMNSTHAVTATFAVPPHNTRLPSISGTPRPGHVLTCNKGTWSGSTPQTYAYHWLRDGVAIRGATAAAYTVKSADAGHAIRCRVTAKNVAGQASKTSAAVKVT